MLGPLLSMMIFWKRFRVLAVFELALAAAFGDGVDVLRLPKMTTKKKNLLAFSVVAVLEHLWRHLNLNQTLPAAYVFGVGVLRCCCC